MGRRKSVKKSRSSPKMGPDGAAAAADRQAEKGTRQPPNTDAMTGGGEPAKSPCSASLEKRADKTGPNWKKRRKTGSPGKISGGIGPAVFLPCLFLALVLGIYLGTLLPAMHAEIFSKDEQRQMPQMPPPLSGSSANQAIEEAANIAAAPSPLPKKDEGGLQGLVAGLVARTEANPRDAHAWIELGNSYFDLNQPRKSIEAYRRALELEPRNTDVLTDMGIMYRASGRPEEALKAFQKAREIDPKHENAMFNEGVVLLNDLKRPEEARAAWERLVEVNPKARGPNGRRVSDLLRQLR